jgi:hypothetical protein
MAPASLYVLAGSDRSAAPIRFDSPFRESLSTVRSRVLGGKPLWAGSSMFVMKIIASMLTKLLLLGTWLPSVDGLRHMEILAMRAGWD